MKKTKKNAPNAETNKQEKDSPQTFPEEQTQETTGTPMPFDLSTIDPEKLKMAEELGIPIGQIINWAASVEARFASIQQNLQEAPQKVVEALRAEAMKNQQAALQQMQQGGSQEGSGATAMLLRTLMSGGGGGVDEEMSGLMKDMFRLNMDRMKQDMTNSMMSRQADAELSGELKRALAKEFAKKTASKLME